MEKQIKTDHQIAKEAKEKAIYDDYTTFMAQPGAMRTKAYEYLCEKHDIKSSVTVWSIVKRVQHRIDQEAAAAPAETI